jgi:hypothetical protein
VTYPYDSRRLTVASRTDRSSSTIEIRGTLANAIPFLERLSKKYATARKEKTYT